MDTEFTLVSSKKRFKPQDKIIKQTTEIQEKIQKEAKILTQEEIMDELISKVKTHTNVDIKTKKIEKETGMFYAINLRVDLSHIGFGVFHSAKLNTVSHINRIVNIKLIFSDNDTLHEDMKINRDALIQCFREIIPNTITSIKIDTFKDQLENEHLCITMSTIKISDLNYIYDKTIEYVNVINEKYGEVQKTIHNYKKYNTQNHTETNDTLTEEPAKVEPAKVEPAKVEPVKVEPVKVETAKVEPAKVEPAKVEPVKVEPAKVEPVKLEILKENKDKNNTKSFEDTETLNNKLIINKSIKHIIEELTKEEKRLLVYLENVKHAQIIILENKSIKHIVSDLKKEEKRLELEIENTRKLLKAQTYVLENTIFNNDILPSEKPLSEKPLSEKPLSENPLSEKNNKTSFAHKVAYGNN